MAFTDQAPSFWSLLWPRLVPALLFGSSALVMSWLMLTAPLVAVLLLVLCIGVLLRA